MKRRIASLLLASMTMTTLLFSGCSQTPPTTANPTPPAGGGATTPAPSTDKNLRFTFVCPINGNVYWNMAVDGMNAAAKELGGIDIDVVGPTQINIEQFLKDLDSTVAAKVDGILTMCFSEEMMKPGIATAAEKGIPLITIDSDGPDTDRLAYIGTDNKEAGKVAGEAMAKITGGKANIAILTADLAAVNMNARVDGFKEAISAYPDMKILTIEVAQDMLTGAQKSQQIITAYPECTAIFTADGQSSKGAAQTLIERDMIGKIKILSFDEDKELLDRIKEGTIEATTAQQPYVMGYEGVKLLKSIIDGNPIASEVTITPVAVINKDNVDQYLANY